MQTRLATLAAPLLFVALLTAVTGERLFISLFALMAALGLALDLGLYAWTIGYQGRWLTLLLGLFELVLLRALMGHFFPFDAERMAWPALGLYAVAWLLGWLTTQVALPWRWPRWAEDGGEFRPVRGPLARAPGILPESLSQRRRDFALALATLGLAAIPWAAGLARTPPGQQFTGVLILDPLHLGAIGQAVRGEGLPGPALALGFIGRLVGWDAPALYYCVWGCAALALALALRVRLRASPAGLRPALLGIAALLPAPWLALLAAALWALPAPAWGRLARGARRLRAAAPVALLVWALILARLPAAPLAYLDAGYWRAAAWLRLQTLPETTVETTPDVAALVSALSGRRAVTTPGAAGATLWLTAGARCDRDGVRFRAGDACLIALERR